MDFHHPYLTQNLIAYIGNKRRLLPLVAKAIESTGLEKQGLRFFDAFSGSGSVSRLAKARGFELYSNDWEEYAAVLGRGFVGTDQADIARLFGGQDGLAALLDAMNALPPPDEGRQYIARWYAPKEWDPDAADFRTERLFYTRQNALRIDALRYYIEETFPSGRDGQTQKRRNLLLALLLYEAATHTNTSGVFKAYHKGFGGHSKDALSRILTPITLRVPPLIDAQAPVHILQEDTNGAVRRRDLQNLDIAYLDPPYNQHQYGSNYHLLNTIARWDGIPAPLELNDKGELKEKAAIRHDWVRTKSTYCAKGTAEQAFVDLVDHLDAHFILISYSTDGIIPFEAMRDICTRRGRVSIVTNEYTTYRGGKQSNRRQNTNIEFILCIDTGRESTMQDVQNIEALLERKKLLLLFKQKFKEASLRAAFPVARDGTVCVTVGGRHHLLETRNLFELKPPADCDTLSLRELRELHGLLAPCACQTKEEELSELLTKAQAGTLTATLRKRIPLTLKKLASKKNKDSYLFWLKKIELLAQTRPEALHAMEDSLNQVKRIAEERFSS